MKIKCWLLGHSWLHMMDWDGHVTNAGDDLVCRRCWSSWPGTEVA